MSARAVYVARSALACDACCAPLDPGAWMQRNEARRFVCLTCAGLAEHTFLAPGDPALTRRATRESSVAAVVFAWNRRRHRYDRQGVLVERDALRFAEWSCRMDEDARASRRETADVRRCAEEASFVRAFAERIRAEFPRMPPKREHEIAEHACAKGSGRVGRSARAKRLHRRAIYAAVIDHAREKETRYAERVAAGRKAWKARQEVQRDVAAVLASWR